MQATGRKNIAEFSKFKHFCFRAFGEIKTLRIPKKLTPGSDQHRGFAFIDYYSKADAKVNHN